MLTQRHRISTGIFCLAILVFLLMIPRSCLWGAEYHFPGASNESVTIELTIQIPSPVLADKAVGMMRSIREGTIEDWILGPTPRLVVVPTRHEQHSNFYVLVTFWAY